MGKTVNKELAVSRNYDCAEKRPSKALVEALADIKNIQDANVPADVGADLNSQLALGSLNHLLAVGEDITISFTFDGYSIRMSDTALTIEID